MNLHKQYASLYSRRWRFTDINVRVHSLYIMPVNYKHFNFFAVFELWLMQATDRLSMCC